MSSSPGISNFRRVKEDIEALKEEVKVVKESAHSATKDSSPWSVRIHNYCSHSQNLDDLIQWEWDGNDPVTEEQWRSFWNSFLRVSSRVFNALPGKRLPIEELIPVPPAHDFSSLVHACVDQWETFKEKYAAQGVLSNDGTRTLSSSSSAFNSVDSGPISDYGTAVNTSTTPPFVPFGYQPINDRSRYDDDRSDLRPSNEHGQAVLEARRRRNPAAYLPSGRHSIADPDGRRHDARALLRQQGYFSGGSRLLETSVEARSLRDTTIRDMTEEEHRNTAIRRAFEERFH